MIYQFSRATVFRFLKRVIKLHQATSHEPFFPTEKTPCQGIWQIICRVWVIGAMTSLILSFSVIRYISPPQTLFVFCCSPKGDLTLPLHALTKNRIDVLALTFVESVEKWQILPRRLLTLDVQEDPFRNWYPTECGEGQNLVHKFWSFHLTFGNIFMPRHEQADHESILENFNIMSNCCFADSKLRDITLEICSNILLTPRYGEALPRIRNFHLLASWSTK